MFSLYVAVLDLGLVVDRLVEAGLKPSTQKTYLSAQKCYIKFCDSLALTPVPTSNAILLLFVASLHARNLKGSSIRVYLAGVRNLHVCRGIDYPEYSPQLQLALKGSVNLSGPPSRKLPITFVVLSEIVPFLEGRHDELMLKSAMYLAFFGCLSAGEICLPDKTVFDGDQHLTCGDIVFNVKEKFLILTLKRSKTDVKNVGVSIHVGCSGVDICAFCVLLLFSKKRDDFLPSRPLFVESFGNILKNHYFQATTRLLLAAGGYDSALFSGHSFRAGSATSAADVGFSDWEIKMLGRWRSDAYNIYLRNPKVVNSFAKRLCKE
jgi:hypothetical protein